MNRFVNSFKPLTWLMALLLAAFVAGCGGGGSSNNSPGDGGGGGGGGGGGPTVSSKSPSDGAVNVPTSTNGPGPGNVVTGKVLTATFSEMMAPLTITPVGTFTLKVTGGANVPGTVTMNTANTIATFTPTASALIADTNYTATITTAATNTAGTAMSSAVSWSFTTGALFTGQAPVDIKTASTYGVFASAASVTLAVDAIVNGDVGLNPAGACGNCVVGTTIIGGVIHNGDAEAIQAQTDFGVAYTEASTRSTSACAISPGELSTAQGACNGYTPGPVYRQGLYRTADPIGVGGGFNITLDAQNNPDAVFIFQTDSTITTGTSSVVNLINGAQAKNVWWIAGAGSTLGVTSIFKGTMIVNAASITVLGGIVSNRTLVEGRLLAGAAIVVNEFATVTVPQ